MPDFPIPSYEQSFSDTVAQITQVVERWAFGDATEVLEIDRFKDMVFIKQTTHLIAHANLAFQHFVGINAPGGEPVINSFLDNATLGIAVKSDELLYNHAQSLDVEYVTTNSDGEAFQLRTHKRWLNPNARNVSILGISRILYKVDPSIASHENLASLAKKYELLDEDSQALCRLMAAGHSQRQIAELLHCTPRTIENRRNRILVDMGVAKPLDIVKFMVRLAEHRFIEANF